MFVVRIFEFASEDSTGGLLERVLDATGPAEIWTFLEDRTSTKTSSVARALKKHPALASLGPPPRGTLRPRLASLPERHDASERWEVSLDPRVAIELARAIPNPLAFMYSHFAIGPLPALWLCPSEPPRPTAIDSRPGHDDLLATVTVLSSWSTSRRRLGLRANVCMPAPARDAAALPPLPDDTRELLARFGRPTRERMELLADADEATARHEADPAAKALADGFALDAIELPLPDLADDTGSNASFGSFIDELPRVLRGYRYAPTGTRGLWRLTKRTAAHNELVFEADRGPMGGHARATLAIRGPLWSHSWTLPTRRGARELTIWSPTTLANACRNWGAVVAALERDVIPELERLYWPGFAWYSAGR